jgi:HAMP domain-containing protein
MMASDIHHRTEDFRKVYRSALADLKEVMGTSHDVLMFCASGTGAMDATVSNLFDGVHNPRIVAVYVPIVRDGSVRFVLTVALPVSTFSEVLRAQPFTPGSVATLEDRQHVILARTKGEAEMVGQRVVDPTPGHEGWARSRLREGQEVYVAFATAPLSGWRVIIPSPVASVDAPLRRALWQLLVGGTVAAALAGTLAFAFGRRIAGAVGSLVRIARAVERGQRAQPLNTGVTEVNTLAEQLRAAADRARKRE